jgi:hypothetical protein
MRDGLQGLYPPSLVTGSVKSRSYECNPQMISPRDMYPLFTRVRGKKNSAKFASRILHRSPSESREDGFWGHSRGVRGIYILRSCIDIRILDCLEGDDPAAGGRLPGYTLFARKKATVRRGVRGEDRTHRSSQCADVDLAARVSIRDYTTYI